MYDFQRMLVLGMALGIGIVGCDIKGQADKEIARAASKAADEAIARYEMAEQNSASPIELCTYAGMVTATLLQAKDEERYKEWQEVQNTECAKAGTPQYP